MNYNVAKIKILGIVDDAEVYTTPDYKYYTKEQAEGFYKHEKLTYVLEDGKGNKYWQFLSNDFGGSKLTLVREPILADEEAFESVKKYREDNNIVSKLMDCFKNAE